MTGITRSVAVAVAALLAAALLGGCGDDTTTALKPDVTASGSSSPLAAPPPEDAPPAGVGGQNKHKVDCPAQANAKRFAKTRFALHAGLALGAFHRYIYKPLRSGGFQSGADERKRTFLKAAVAGAFAIHELRVAQTFAEANPTLCKAVMAVDNRFSDLTNKLEKGNAAAPDLEASKNSFDGLRQSASQNGYNFNEQNVAIPGAS
ncbi:hypothetical protein [Streptosporangium sp. NPDC023615]|uniref:hypothetical protein n=1 Tax=Streptosporangium sp. NPDC023615 TaxID=3154794 RepID=UPI00343161E4